MTDNNIPEEVSWLHVTERAAEQIRSHMESNTDNGSIIALVSMGFG